LPVESEAVDSKLLDNPRHRVISTIIPRKENTTHNKILFLLRNGLLVVSSQIEKEFCYLTVESSEAAALGKKGCRIESL
jgi:hypothetical protein